MTLLLKDPEATLDYSIDWGAQYLSDDCLVDSKWRVEPQEAGGLTVMGSQFDAKVATAQVAGGLLGHVYRLSNHVVTLSGHEDRRSVTLRLDKR